MQMTKAAALLKEHNYWTVICSRYEGEQSGNSWYPLAEAGDLMVAQQRLPGQPWPHFTKKIGTPATTVSLKIY